MSSFLGFEHTTYPRAVASKPRLPVFLDPCGPPHKKHKVISATATVGLLGAQRTSVIGLRRDPHLSQPCYELSPPLQSLCHKSRCFGIPLPRIAIERHSAFLTWWKRLQPPAVVSKGQKWLDFPQSMA